MGNKLQSLFTEEKEVYWYKYNKSLIRYIALFKYESTERDMKDKENCIC